MKKYKDERDGQIDFFDNYGINYEDDASILVDNTDGVYNGNIFEFKTAITNLNKVLGQAIKYCSRLRIKGESVPATILLIDLNAAKAYKYSSKDYIDEIQKVYIGPASKDNGTFLSGEPDEVIDYSDMVGSNRLKKLLKSKKTITQMYVPIDIDENCIVGWAERYYREKPKASKGDFLGDDIGQVKVIGEIRDPKHFKGLINKYEGKSNEKFKYLMDCLNDRLSKKDLGAFYTPEEYCKKAAELVQMAVARVPDGNDYIILDRCAGTGNLEAALIGLKDKNGDDLIGHCVVSTYEYYEYKVLNERIGELVRDIIPPTEADVRYESGKVSNADAMTEDFLNNPIINAYLSNDKCSVILFENPPYDDTSSIRAGKDEDGSKHKTQNKSSYIFQEMSKEKDTFKNSNISTIRDFANRFIWSAYKYYLRQSGDSYIVFSPVKYFKSLGIFEKQPERFVKGFLFNRKHFHATTSSIGCVLWSYETNQKKPYDMEIYDIDNGALKFIGNTTIKETFTTLSASNSKYHGTKTTKIACDAHGMQIIGRKFDTTIYVDDAVIGYFCPVSASYDMGRLPYFNGRGAYITKDNYLNVMPLFAAKQYPFDLWYEKDSVFITYDGKDAYTKDADFVKASLIYGCLTDLNKCLTFDGLDGNRYINALCFDDDTLARRKLSAFSLTPEEQQLIGLWDTILKEAKATGKCNPDYKYGVYQIKKEINTSHQEGKGKHQKVIYDHPKLNGDLTTLKELLKDYYKKNIAPKLFQYELLK